MKDKIKKTKLMMNKWDAIKKFKVDCYVHYARLSKIRYGCKLLIASYNVVRIIKHIRLLFEKNIEKHIKYKSARLI